eukprot:13322013-Ditylum_brightwellii.AAC.2
MRIIRSLYPLQYHHQEDEETLAIPLPLNTPIYQQGVHFDEPSSHRALWHIVTLTWHGSQLTPLSLPFLVIWNTPIQVCPIIEVDCIPINLYQLLANLDEIVQLIVGVLQNSAWHRIPSSSKHCSHSTISTVQVLAEHDTHSLPALQHLHQEVIHRDIVVHLQHRPSGMIVCLEE